VDDPAAAPTVVPVMFGRQLAVPRAASGVASFHFLDLCGGPLGAADYMALAQNYHTVFITGEGSDHSWFSLHSCASCACNGALCMYEEYGAAWMLHTTVVASGASRLGTAYLTLGSVALHNICTRTFHQRKVTHCWCSAA
jgi:hypothetical protein